MSNSKDLFWGKAITAIGVVLLLQTVDLVSWRLWEFVWPICLIVCGILLIRRPESFVGCCGFGNRDAPEKAADPLS